MKATIGSQKWLQDAVNLYPEILDDAIRTSAGMPSDTKIEWVSPLATEDYAEYRDQAFVERLGLNLRHRPLSNFWSSRGPMWDGLARTSTGEVLLIEAKAHIPEMVSPATKASPASLDVIENALRETRKALVLTPTEN